MKKNWIKKHAPSAKSLQNSRGLKVLKPYLKHEDFWSRDMQPVARGVAAGLAGSVLPGFQLFYAALLAILLRGNFPLALVFTLVTNPLTAAPIMYFTYYIGSLFVGNGSKDIAIKSFTWDFTSWHVFWTNVGTWALQFGKGYLVGVPIVSVCLGVIGYLGTILIWKVSVLFFGKKRKKSVTKKKSSR